MTKLFVILPALALAVALSGNATAENGAISSATLNDMGLAGIELMSDEAAMEIRGQGFLGRLGSRAYGDSYANIGSRRGPRAGSENGFRARGKYMAMGENFSEALITRTKTKELWIKGVLATKKVRTRSLSVAAGGMASASSF